MNRYIKIYQNLRLYGFLDEDNKPTKVFDEYNQWRIEKIISNSEAKKYEQEILKEEVLERRIKDKDYDIKQLSFDEWKIKNEDVISKKFDTLNDLRKDGVISQEEYNKMADKTNIILKEDYRISIIDSDVALEDMLSKLSTQKAITNKMYDEDGARGKFISELFRDFYKLFNSPDLRKIYDSISK